MPGRCRVGRLNLDGDGQGDLAGHGGEQRAVFVYQIESYRYWQEQLKRTDFVHGQFGENFTIEGLPDDAVCIGDRYRIGSALFEVTQPRVTCYRVGIRMNEPRMPALLTSSGRPGFYFRVLEEGEVGAGRRDREGGRGEGADDRRGDQRAALFARSSARSAGARLADRGALARLALVVRGAAAEPDGGAGSGNAGLAPAAAAHPAAPGFRPLAVTAIDRESADVLSLTMQSADGQPLPAALPGQYVVLRLRRTAGGPPLFRSYSLSGPLSTERYRISVKVEPNGAAGTYLREHVRVGDALDVSAPRGSFVLQSGGAAGRAAQRGDRGDAGAGDAARAGGGPLDTAGPVAPRGARSGSIIRSPPRSAASCARSRTAAATSATAGRARTTRWARTSTPPATCRGRSSTRSASRATRMSTSAGRLASWRR